MSVNLTAIPHLVIMGLTENVFGDVRLTVTVLMVLLVVFALFVRIPFPFALALNIPLCMVFVAFGYMSALVGGLLSLAFLVLAVLSMLSGLDVKS